MPRALSWHRQSCLRIGQALLQADDRTLTAPQIAAASGQTNVKRTADEMVSQGMLEERPASASVTGTRGRRAVRAYHLPEAQAAELRRLLGTAPSPGRLDSGDQMVLTPAGDSDSPALFETLERTPALSQASWFALIDGEPQQYGIIFQGAAAIDNAEELTTALRGADLTARRAPISEVGRAMGLVERARRNARQARAARLRRSTREATTG